MAASGASAASNSARSRWKADDTAPTRVTDSTVAVEVWRARNSNRWPGASGAHEPRCDANSAPSTAACSGGRVRSHAASTGGQSRSVSDTYTMPARDTVAGDAFSRFSFSNMIFTFSVMGMRSPDASVSSLLSSSTVFSDSIHSVSTGPSHVIHVLYGSVRLLYFCHVAAKMPVSHSPLSASVCPNSSWLVTALGFRRTILCAVPVVLCSAVCRISMMRVLPPAA